MVVARSDVSRAELIGPDGYVNAAAAALDEAAAKGSAWLDSTELETIDEALAAFEGTEDPTAVGPGSSPRCYQP